MKIAILAAMLAVAACAQTPAPVSNATEPAPSAAQASVSPVADEQALWAAEALYNVPAQAYVAADSRGVLPASVKSVVKPKLVRLYSLLKVARSAYTARNSKGFFEAVSNMKLLKSEVDVMLAFYSN